MPPEEHFALPFLGCQHYQSGLVRQRSSHTAYGFSAAPPYFVMTLQNAPGATDQLAYRLSGLLVYYSTSEALQMNHFHSHTTDLF